MPSNTPSSHHPTLSGGSQNEQLFQLFGDYVWGDLEPKEYGDKLDLVGLPHNQRRSWSDFIANYQEEYKDQQRGSQVQPSFAMLPVVEDEDVQKMWKTLKKAPTMATWSGLVAQRSSQQTSSQGSASSSRPKARLFVPGSKPATLQDIDDFFSQKADRPKRQTRPPKHMEVDYHSDASSNHYKPSTSSKSRNKKGGASKRSVSDSNLAAKSQPPRKKTKPMTAQEEREMRAAIAGRNAESDLGSEDPTGSEEEGNEDDKNDDGEKHPEEDDSDDDVFHPAPPAPDEDGSEDAFSIDSDEDAIAASLQPPPAAQRGSASSTKTKGKGKQKQTVSSSKASMSKAVSSSKASMSKAVSKAKRPSQPEPEPIHVDDIEDDDSNPSPVKRPAKGIGSRGSKYVICYHKGPEQFEKKRDSFGKAYMGVYRMWKCRLCTNEVKVPNEEVTRLALHFNPRSTSYCKNKFDPEDKFFVGWFQPTDFEKELLAKKAKLAMINKKASKASTAAASSSVGDSEAPGAPGSIDDWLERAKRRTHKMLTAVVRRRSIAWILLEALPFTIVTKRAFLDMIESISPAALASFKSARQVQRDVNLVSMSLFDQAISLLQNHTFSIQIDEWTSPGMQHAFQALVVSFIDKNWIFRTHLIDFQVLQARHSGSTFAGHIVGFLKDNDLVSRWNGVVTTDSASSNTRMSSLLDQELRQTGTVLKHPFDPQRNHIRCFAHHLNLVVQALYVALGVPKESGGPKEAKVLEPVGGVAEDGADDDGDDEGIRIDEWSDDEVDEPAAEEGTQPGGQPFEVDNAEDGDGQVLLDDMDPALMPVKLATIPEEDEDEDAASLLAGALFTANAGLAQGSTSRDKQAPGVGAAAGVEAGQASADANSQQGEAPSSAQPYSSPLVRINSIVKIARSSPERRRKFLRVARQPYSNRPTKAARVRIPPAFNSTRWNSRYFQLQVALRYAKGLTFVVRSNVDGDYGVELDIKPEEIKMLKKVCDILGFFLQLTKAVERHEPTAADILRYHGFLAHVLDVEIQEAKKTGGEAATFFSNALQTAANKLAVYRNRALECDSLLLAAVLDPRYRVSQLQKYFGDQTVQRAKDLLRTEVARDNQGVIPAALPAVVSPATGAAKTKWRSSPEPAQSSDTDEVTAYLCNGFPHRSGEKVLEWWRDNERNLPKLARVARRVLASVGSTAEVERVFSAAGRVLSPRRRRVAPKTLQNIIIAQQLIRTGYDPMIGTVLVDDIAADAEGGGIPQAAL
ncbi:hypothetical protein OC835_007013 [Tilletia horrida]|nr:hypothetical protein OC835_007013 [Tilletia horrida]